MDRTDRKAARAAWDERKPDAGIYAVRIGDAVWVGAAPRLSAAENRMRFTLETALTRDPELAAAYRNAGSWRFEVLEAFDPELGPMTRERRLKERAVYWRETLGARRI